jgi:hypothetical protein
VEVESQAELGTQIDYDLTCRDNAAHRLLHAKRIKFEAIISFTAGF